MVLSSLRARSVPDHRYGTRAPQHRALDPRLRFARIEPHIGKQVENGVDRTLQLDLRDELSDANMGSKAEAERGLLTPVDIERVRVVKYALITVRRGDHALHKGPLGDLAPADL